MSDLFLPSLPSKGARDNSRVWQRSIAETFPFLARVAVVGLGNAWCELLAWADVENSARWQPRRTAAGNNATFCNLYAWDIGKQLHPEFKDVIPALWFNRRGIQQVRGGTFTKVEYAENVVSVGANGLADWFAKFGAEFGWTVIPATIQNEPEIQDAVNRGALGYITCANVNRSRAGHVAVVVHDDAGRDVAGEGLLQSQAGSTNYELRRSRWYTARSFNTVGADGKPTKGRRMFAYKFL